MIRIALWAVGSVIALGIGIACIGWLLPVAHVASRSAVIAAPPPVVFDRISTVEQYPAWWRDVTRVERLPAADGIIRFRQHDGNGTIVMEVVESSPPSRRVTRIADPDQPFGGTWTWDLVPERGHTRVTVTEHGEIYNPMFRFFARFVFGYTGTMDSHLAALQAAGRW